MSIFDLILSEEGQRKQAARREIDARNALSPLIANDNSPEALAAATVGRRYANRNLGWRETDPSAERYQFWPEKMVRSGLTAPRDAYTGALPMVDPETGRTSMQAIERAQDVAGLVLGGSMPAMAKVGGKATLGAAGGRAVQPEIPRITAEQPFYSAVEHAIANAKQDKMSPEQWAGWLKNQPGVKGEELNWLGLTDQLPQELKGPVTKDQMLQYARQHGPEIKEVVKGKTTDPAALEEARLEYINDTGVEPSPQQLTRYVQERNDYMGARDLAHVDNTKFSDYQLPGGENYREMLLTTPNGNPLAKLHAEYKALSDEHLAGTLSPEKQKRWAKVDEEINDLVKKGANLDEGVFRSNHWDEPNVLAHVRMNDREIPGVGKSMHLEEIQSDWHQKGRKEGYKDDRSKNLSNYTAEFNSSKDAWQIKDKQGNDVGVVPGSDLGLDMHSAKNAVALWAKSGGVPDAPFKTTWADMALKRAINKAVNEGYDSISWTPGKQQAERYDLSKQVDGVHYDPKSHELRAYKKDTTHPVMEKKVAPEELATYIGKDAAEKILNSPTDKINQNGNVVHRLEGSDLSVGGEGMKGFYDKMLVDKANALAKKFGGKVEYQKVGHDAQVEIVKSNGGHTYYMIKGNDEAGPWLRPEDAQQWIKENTWDIPVLRIPKQMRDHISTKGQPLFVSGLPFQFTPVEGNPFEAKNEGR